MKKVSKINLYNLSKAGLSDKEMSMINGGYNSGTNCMCMCFGSACRCVEDEYGGFSTTVGITEQNIDTDAEKNAHSDVRETPKY